MSCHSPTERAPARIHHRLHENSTDGSSLRFFMPLDGLSHLGCVGSETDDHTLAAMAKSLDQWDLNCQRKELSLATIREEEEH